MQPMFLQIHSTHVYSSAPNQLGFLLINYLISLLHVYLIIPYIFPHTGFLCQLGLVFLVIWKIYAQLLYHLLNLYRIMKMCVFSLWVIHYWLNFYALPGTIFFLTWRLLIQLSWLALLTAFICFHYYMILIQLSMPPNAL